MPGVVVIVLLAIVMILIGYMLWTQPIANNTGAIMTGLGALGTLFLAYSTLMTVKQNRLTIEQNEDLVSLQEERVDKLDRMNKKEKYQVIHEQVIQPAKDVIEENKTKLESNSYNWNKQGGSDFKKIHDHIQTHETNLRVFESEFDELSESFSKHDNLIDEFDSDATTFSKALSRGIRDWLRARMPEEDKQTQNDAVDAVIEQIVNNRKSTSDLPDAVSLSPQEIQATHGGSEKYSIGLSESYMSELDTFKNTKQELIDFIDDLMRALLDAESDLSEEYFIALEEPDRDPDS